LVRREVFLTLKQSYARANGATTVTFRGRESFRTETAGPVVTAIILYDMGELGVRISLRDAKTRYPDAFRIY